MKLFAPPPSSGGCASGDCLPDSPEAAAKNAANPTASSATATAAAATSANTTAATSTTATSAAAPPANSTAPSPHSNGARPAASPPSSAFEPSDDDEPAPAPAGNRPAGAMTHAELWRKAVDQVRDSNVRLGQSLANARFLSAHKGEVRVVFPSDAGFHRASVMQASKAQIEAVLGRYFGPGVKLLEDTKASFQSIAPSIAEQEASARQHREQSIEARVRVHPAVRSVLSVLGGTLEFVNVLEAAPKPKAVATDAAASPEDDEPAGEGS